MSVLDEEKNKKKLQGYFNRQWKQTKSMRKINCYEGRPCKLTSCKTCVWKRRNYFIDSAILEIERNNLFWEVILNFPSNEENGWNAWFHFRVTFRNLSKSMSRGIGPFIRTLGIGKNLGNGHVHFLVSKESALFIRRVAKAKGISSNNIIFKHIPSLRDARNVLGYLYDQNFLVVSNHPEKIKGLRVITGSRFGFSYGYPSRKNNEELKRKTREVKWGKLGWGLRKLGKKLT